MTKKQVFCLFVGWIALLAFAFQGQRGIWQPDEGYYTAVAVCMEKSGDYLVPRIGEEIFLDKPPLLYWGILGGRKLLGTGEGAARFFGASCFALTCLLVFDLGRSLFGRFRDGLSAGLIYGTMILPFSAANFITMDTPLTLFTTAAMAAFWRSVRPAPTHPTLWKMVLCAIVGLGFLTKGPAALIPCGAMFLYLLIRKEAVSYFWTGWFFVGLLLFGLFGLTWYCYVSFLLPEAAEYFFDSQIWGRLVSDKYQRNPGLAGALIYLPVLLLGTLPWSVDWFIHKKGVQSLFSRDTWRGFLAAPSALLLVCWICLPMLVLCTASSKLGLYALPVFPALALVSSRLVRFPSCQESLLRHRIRFVSSGIVWGLLLLASRWAMGHIPTGNDCLALWQELQDYLPAGRYEIVAVDERVDGLLFYGAMEVENITRRKEPYPTFIPPEIVETEVREMLEDRFDHLYLLRGRKYIAEIRQVLQQSSWSVEEMELKFNRRLLLCRPPLENLTSLCGKSSAP